MSEVYEINLRYGMNPHQKQAKLTAGGKPLPIRVLNGEPGFINLLDALNGFQLVRELRRATGLPPLPSSTSARPAPPSIRR